jgi:hypothetical protein
MFVVSLLRYAYIASDKDLIPKSFEQPPLFRRLIFPIYLSVDFPPR